MRCPDCNKFVSQEAGDPEVEDLTYTTGTITGQVHITQNCAECGNTLKEAYLDVEIDSQFCSDNDHEVSMDESVSNADRSEGTGRYRKTFYGADLTIKLTCSCGKEGEATWHDDIAASSMDETV